MLPAIGMGSWKLGMNEAEEIAALKRGLELGMRFIDTAEMYGTEPLVGKAIKGEDVFVATKVWPDHFRHDDVLRACDASLHKLGLKTVDLYQLHWPNYNVPIAETLKAMEELLATGKIRHIGVSNFSVEDLEEARASLKSSDIVSNQVEYSIITRDPERELAKYCRKNGITMIAYSPLGHGALFEKQNAALLRSMASIGGRHGKTAAQVALAWLASKDNVVSIPKASTVRHVEENAAAGEPWLSDEELQFLDHESLKFQKAPLAEGFWQRHTATYGKRNGTGKESF